MTVKLNNEKLRYIALFEKLTGATPRDCIGSGEEGNHLTFIIDESDMGRAIGQNGRNIKKVRKELDKRVDVIEYSDDPEQFLRNIFSSVEVLDISISDDDEGKTKAMVEVDQNEKGRAVGKNGWNIKRARKLLERHHGLSDVQLA